MACQQHGLSWALLQWAELYWEREPDLLGSRVIFHFSYWENFFPLDSVVLWCRWESIGAIFRVTCIFLSFLIPIHITLGLLNTIHFRYPMLNLGLISGAYNQERFKSRTGDNSAYSMFVCRFWQCFQQFSNLVDGYCINQDNSFLVFFYYKCHAPPLRVVKWQYIFWSQVPVCIILRCIC